MDVGVLVNAFYNIFRKMAVGFHNSVGGGSLGFTEKAHESNVNVTFT